MSVEENKATVLEFLEASRRGDPDEAAALFADDGIDHGRRVPRDRIRAVAVDISRTFGSYDLKIETVVADREWVVLRTIMSGKHVGNNVMPICCLTPGTEATGGDFSIQIIHMFRLADGKIIEHWAGRDDIPAPDWYKA